MNIKNKLIETIEKITDEKMQEHIYTNVLKNTDILSEKYNNWWHNKTDELNDLHMKILMYEDYFDDMCLSTGSIIGKYLETPYGDFKEDVESLSLDAFKYRFYISELLDSDGTTQEYNRKIIISNKCINNKDVILHEMLHAHENIIMQSSTILRDILLFELYKALKTKINKLDEIILCHANIAHNLELSKVGGEHDLLFLLKSLDLDLRCGFDLFTVFGYDYKRHFSLIE